MTNDAAALTDTELDELASMEEAFNAGQLSKAKEDWVLITTARFDDKLHGYTFSTLERIGGTPCVLLGLMSVRRSSKRGQVLRGLMAEAYHRALMAFPDEDVVVGAKFVTADALEAFKSLDDVDPVAREQRGRRGAGVGSAPRQALRRRLAATTRRCSPPRAAPALGSSTTRPETRPPSIPTWRRCSPTSQPGSGAVKVVYGWTMAEDLAKLGARS